MVKLISKVVKKKSFSEDEKLSNENKILLPDTQLPDLPWELQFACIRKSFFSAPTKLYITYERRERKMKPLNVFIK